MLKRIFRQLAIILLLINKINTEYEPTWESLDTRPLPQWYDQIKIGIFIHWGVYAVPSYGVEDVASSEWFWAYWKGKNEQLVEFMKNNYPPTFTYQDFAKEFRAELFNASQWAQLFKNAGARYVVLTSKHHEGFTLWPSKYSFSWNSQDVGPHKDLIGDLAKAVRKEGLEFGLYHSMYEWYNPIYNSDKDSNFTKQDFVRNKYMPEIHDLVNTYEPSILWVDGEWDADYTYWNSTNFLCWLYNDSPIKDHVVVNDRWGKGLGCKHGDFYSCADRYNPGVLQNHKWEATATLDKESWGFRRNAKVSDYMTSHELIEKTVEAVSCGGNMLINVGPTKEGTIIPIMQERLLDLGEWLTINGEGIYESKPWTTQNDTSKEGIQIWYTTNINDDIYTFITQWPQSGKISVSSLLQVFLYKNPIVSLLEKNSSIQVTWKIVDELVQIELPPITTVSSKWIWTLKVSPNSENVIQLI